RRRTAHHPGVGVDALELLLERRRFLLDRSEICGIRLPSAERPEHEQPGDRRRRGHAPCPPAAAPPAPLHQHRIAHDRPAVARGATYPLGPPPPRLLRCVTLHRLPPPPRPPRPRPAPPPPPPGRPPPGSPSPPLPVRRPLLRAAPPLPAPGCAGSA